jgi:hypothetical protein
MRNKVLRLAGALLALVVTSGHAVGASAQDYILELRLPNADNPPFSQWVYPCLGCTLAQFAAVVPPTGFLKAPPKLFLPSGASVVLPVAPPGVPQTLDLVPGIPGPDFVLTARVLSAQIVGFDPTLGPLAVAQVQRDTVFHYDAGEVVHELTDPAGNTYTLFGFDVVLSSVIDVTQPGALAGLGLPSGWAYSSRVLPSELLLVSNGLASVFSQGGAATWQRLEEIPVAVDVKPSDTVNTINPSSNGLVPVAILGSEDLDVETIHVATLAFGPAGAAPVHAAGGHVSDVDGDGIADLVSHYANGETGIGSGDFQACVAGETLAGAPFRGCDAVVVHP